MILASVPRRPHNVCRAERYNRQLPTQLINLTIYTVCERHALTSHNSGYYGYGSAVSPERGARLSGRSLAEHVAVSIGRKRLSGSTTLETSLALDVIGCIRDACVRASVWRERGGNISSRNTEEHRVGELQREKECAIRFRPPFDRFIPIVLASPPLSDYRESTTLGTHVKYTCQVSSKGSMQSLELSPTFLACDLRYEGSLDNEHVDAHSRCDYENLHDSAR